MSGVFLSYSRADRALAESVVNGLRRIGVEVWWDQDMPGVEWQQELEREINTLAVVVVLWSANSANSNYVRDEARLALHGGKLVNALFGVHSPPFPFDRVNGLPLDGWNGHDPHHGWSRLVQTVSGFVVKAGGAEEGEIQAALAKSEQDFRLKDQGRTAAQEAFQDAQTRESDAGEAAKAAEASYLRAEEQLQRVGEMRASSTILGAAQREVEAARAAKDEADKTHRAAKAALSTASRAFSKAKADFDSAFGPGLEPPKPKPKAPRKPKAAAPASDPAVDAPPASDADTLAASAAADAIVSEPPVSPPPLPPSPPVLPPPPPPPVSPPPPPPPVYVAPQPYPQPQPYPPRPGMTSAERVLLIVGILGGVLLLLIIVIVIAIAATHHDNTSTTTGANLAVADSNSAMNAMPTDNSAAPSNAADTDTNGLPQTPGAASAGTQATASSFSVTTCNKTQEVLGVAVSYVPVGETTTWRNVGFYSLNPGDCKNLFSTQNSYFYLRAEDANNYHWGEDTKLCLQHPGPYDFNTKANDPCPDGANTDTFASIDNTAGTDYTWDFNP